MINEQSIGGYFELEITNFESLHHDNAFALNTGRNCLEHILKCKQYKHIYIPYYTCEVILEPLKRLELPYTFYRIDSKFLPILPEIEKDSALLYTNYFGLMNNNIIYLNEKYTNLIIDNAQAFYDAPLKNIPTFYSPRKFFGLPDGGFVYFANEFSPDNYPIDVSFERCSHLIESVELGKEKSYEQFKANDNALIGQPIKGMSNLTKKLMYGIDYQKVKKIRISNFNFLHNKLKDKNILTPFIEQSMYNCPMIYPFLAKGNKLLRSHLINQRIYTATYWPNVIDWVKKETFEHELTQNLIHLPIDQRYNENDLKFVISTIENLQSNND